MYARVPGACSGFFESMGPFLRVGNYGGRSTVDSCHANVSKIFAFVWSTGTLIRSM